MDHLQRKLLRFAADKAKRKAEMSKHLGIQLKRLNDLVNGLMAEGFLQDRTRGRFSTTRTGLNALKNYPEAARQEQPAPTQLPQPKAPTIDPNSPERLALNALADALVPRVTAQVLEQLTNNYELVFRRRPTSK